MAFQTVGVKIILEGVAAFERGMRRVGASTDKTAKEIAAAEKRSKDFNRAMNRMGIALLAAGAAAGAFIFSATKLAARVETLGVVTVILGRNIGKTEKEIRELEEAIQKQGITMRGSRRAVALMIQSQIDLAKGTELARLAQNAAVIANINSTEAFTRLVFVITSGNVRMARTLGLQVSFQQAYKKTAQELGKNVTELTQLEKVQARTNAVLATGTTIAGAYSAAMDTAGKKVLSLDRLVEDSMVVMGEGWLPIYGKAVDTATEFLEAFLDASTAQQSGISATVASTAAFAALSGAALVFISMVPGIVAGLQLIGVASLGIAGPLGFVAAALGLIFVAASKAAGENKILEGSIGRLRRRFDIGLITQKEFRKQLEEVTKGTTFYNQALLVNENRASSAATMNESFEDTLERLAFEKFPALSLTMGEAGKEAGLMDEKIAFMVNRLNNKLAPALETAEERTKRLAEEEEALREETQRLSEEFQAIKQLASVDLTQAFEDYQGKVEDLNATIKELENRVYLTPQQEEDLAKTREELEKTNAAWKKNTAVVIANLFEQAIAIGGFTKEEILAFAALQEQLGLVDEGYAALTRAVFDQAEQLDDTGDQIDETVTDMAELFQSMLDPTAQAGALAEQIARIRSKQVRIDAIITTRAGAVENFVLPPTAAPTPAPVTTPKRQIRLQAGGFAQRGRAHLVGEGGPEIFVPGQSGTVLKNAFVQALSSISSMLRGISPALSAVGVGGPVTNLASTSSQMTNNFNMTVNTQAPIEPIVADFRSMQALANAV